jgi:hypothetical protein
LENIEFTMTKEDFFFLNRMILGMGYHIFTKNDSRRTFTRLDLSAPRPLEGRETSYRYTNNNYTAKVHTTYLEREGKWRDKSTDIGWVLIAEGDEAKYFARPFQRKKGFILKILRYAWITKWKVDHRPLCPVCHDNMEIKRKKHSRGYYWACMDKEKHPNGLPEFLPWNYGVPPKAAEFLEIRREYTARYNAKNRKEGKTPTPAAVIRKKWPIGNPENLTKGPS